MSSYIIGIDFGTSQTKVCVLNEELKTRKFYKFPNGSLFLPSVIVKNKSTGKFSYGNTDILDDVENDVFRYFKMAAVEDEDLIQRTYEDKDGKLEEGKKINDYRKYSSQISEKPENLVILFLCYVQLYIKSEIESNKSLRQRLTGFINRFRSDKQIEDTYTIHLGIPTHWNNSNEIQSKNRFERLLLVSKWLSDECLNLDTFLNFDEKHLTENISSLSNKIKVELGAILKENKLAVYPESAAGVCYLIENKKLEELKVYGVLDIGAGTSDIALIEIGASDVNDNNNHNNNEPVINYYCSETVAIAANSFYQKYIELTSSKDYKDTESKVFDLNEIAKVQKQMESNNLMISDEQLCEIRIEIRGEENYKGVEGAIMKMFAKFHLDQHNKNKYTKSLKILRTLKKDNPKLIIFGGGSNLPVFKGGNYSYFPTPQVKKQAEYILKPVPITEEFLTKGIILNSDKEVSGIFNLLVLALGLTYIKVNSPFIPIKILNVPASNESERDFEEYQFQYDTD